jgi:hypothetical protein
LDFTAMGGKRQGREVPQSLRVEPSAKHPVWKTQSRNPKQNYQALKNNQAINSALKRMAIRLGSLTPIGH